MLLLRPQNLQIRSFPPGMRRVSLRQLARRMPGESTHSVRLRAKGESLSVTKLGCFIAAVINKYSIKRTISVLSTLLLLFLIFACAAPQQQTLRTEKDFLIAFNEAYFRGKAKMEVPVRYGRIDLLTDDYVIEVDKLEKFHEAIGQALY